MSVAVRLSSVTNCFPEYLNAEFIFIHRLFGAEFLENTLLHIHICVSSTLSGSHDYHVGDTSDRRQPLHHRVSAVKSAHVVHQFEGEDTVGCRAPLCCSVRQCSHCHGDLFRRQNQTHSHYRLSSYVGHYPTNMHPGVVEHSPGNSTACSSSYADAESE